MPRGKAEFTTMDYTGSSVKNQDHGLAQKPDVKQSLKGHSFEELDGDMRITKKEFDDGLVWKTGSGGISYGAGDAPFKAAEDKIRAERAEANARNLANESHKRGIEAQKNAEIAEGRSRMNRRMIERVQEAELDRDIARRDAKMEIERGIGRAKKAGQEIGQKAGLRRAAKVGIPLAAAGMVGSYLLGRNTKPEQKGLAKPTESFNGSGNKSDYNPSPLGSLPHAANSSASEDDTKRFMNHTPMQQKGMLDFLKRTPSSDSAAQPSAPAPNSNTSLPKIDNLSGTGMSKYFRGTADQASQYVDDEMKGFKNLDESLVVKGDEPQGKRRLPGDISAFEGGKGDEIVDTPLSHSMITRHEHPEGISAEKTKLGEVLPSLGNATGETEVQRLDNANPIQKREEGWGNTMQTAGNKGSVIIKELSTSIPKLLMNAPSQMPAMNAPSQMPAMRGATVKGTGEEHPGFKATQEKIAEKYGGDMEKAGAILASKTRHASAAAKAKNPRLNKVKGKGWFFNTPKTEEEMWEHHFKNAKRSHYANEQEPGENHYRLVKPTKYIEPGGLNGEGQIKAEYQIKKEKGIGTDILEHLRPIGNLADDVVQVGVRKVTGSSSDPKKTKNVETKTIGSFIRRKIGQPLKKKAEGFVQGAIGPQTEAAARDEVRIQSEAMRPQVEAAARDEVKRQSEAMIPQLKKEVGKRTLQATGTGATVGAGAGALGGAYLMKPQEKVEEKSFGSHLFAGGVGALAGGVLGSHLGQKRGLDEGYYQGTMDSGGGKKLTKRDQLRNLQGTETYGPDHEAHLQEEIKKLKATPAHKVQDRRLIITPSGKRYEGSSGKK